MVAITPHPWPREIASMTGRKPEGEQTQERFKRETWGCPSGHGVGRPPSHGHDNA
jgi:hypothetical protein